MKKRVNFLNVLKKGFVVILVLVFVCVGACLTYSYNFNKDRGFYEASFSYTEEVSISKEDIISKENIQKVQAVETSYFTGGNISTYSFVKIKAQNISISLNDQVYTIKINTECFDKLPSTAKVDTVAKGFIKHLTIMPFDSTLYTDTTTDGKTIKGVSALLDGASFSIDSYTDTNQRDKMIMWGLIGMGIGLVIGTALVLILGYKFKDKLDKEDIYDNEKIFRTPFHRAYWRHSCRELGNVRKLVIMAILLAFTLASKLIPLPSGFGNLGLGWGLIFLSVGGMLLGPVPALIMGAISDTLGYFISGTGTFFFGYTVQAMLACFMYGILFYRTRINFTRVLLARTVINFIANALWGSICWGIISDFNFQQTMDYMLVVSLPKNIAYLIPQSLLIFVVLKCVVPIADISGYIEPKIAENVTIF